MDPGDYLLPNNPSDIHPRGAANFWVRLPSDQDFIYLYWGDPSAVYAGSGWSVFDLFDDFNDASFNTTQWTQYMAPASGGMSVTEGPYVGGFGTGSLAIKCGDWKNTPPYDGFYTPICFVMSSETFSPYEIIEGQAAMGGWQTGGCSGYDHIVGPGVLGAVLHADRRAERGSVKAAGSSQ